VVVEGLVQHLCVGAGPCPAGVPAQSPDHDANGRGGTGDQPGNAAASRRRVALATPGRSAVRGLADRLWLALQVQQYHPGRVTDRVLPSTRETVTIVSGCMQQPQVVHFIGQDLLWHRPSDLGGKFGTNKEPQASRADQRRARLAAKA